MKKIFVTGPTGTIGSALLPHLLVDGIEVIALARNPEKITPHKNLHIVKGDLANPASYSAKLTEVDAAFLLTSGIPEMLRLQTDFIDACAQQKVPFVLKQSALGAGSNKYIKMFEWHRQIEDHLKTKKIGYAFIQPNTFTQNILAHANSIQQQNAIYAPTGEGKVSYIDARDIARAAAAILLNPLPHKNKTYHLTGRVALSMGEVAEIVGKLIEKDVHFIPVTVQQGKEALMGFGMEEWLVDDITAIAMLAAEGKAAEVTDDFRQITGDEPKTVESSLADFKTVFTTPAASNW